MITRFRINFRIILCCDLLLLFAVTLCSNLLAVHCSAQEAALTTEAWKKDLDFLAKTLPRAHKNLFFKLPRKEFEAQVQRISESLPAMTDAEIRVALCKLVSSVGDGHTMMGMGGAYYPIRFLLFPDGVYVRAALPEYSRTIGARLVGVGNLDIDEVRKRVLPLVPSENDLTQFLFLPLYLISAEALNGTHILSGKEEGTFHFEKDGQSFSFTMRSLPAKQQGDFWDRPDGAVYEKPLYLSDREKNYWFRYLGEARALYIRYISCEEMKSLSFAEFTKQVMNVADHNPVDKVILDLRHNSGGNSWVGYPLYKALKARPALRRKGRLFVLTNQITYSSGFLNAYQAKRLLGAKMVGEPSAQKPNCYGDLRTYKLPNSGLGVSYSTQHFRWIFWRNPAWVEPDVRIELMARDYFSGRDPVLERVLSW
jgi:hypothetical protein